MYCFVLHKCICIILAGASLRSAPLVARWKNLLPISLYVVLGAGRKQFGILEGIRSVECVPPRHWSFSSRQSPESIWTKVSKCILREDHRRSKVTKGQGSWLILNFNRIKRLWHLRPKKKIVDGKLTKSLCLLELEFNFTLYRSANFGETAIYMGQFDAYF